MEHAIQIQTLRNEENKTYKQIEDELGVSSKTIAKALFRPVEFTEGYHRDGPVPRPVLGAFLQRIEELLKGKDWAKEKGRKVRRTSRWVYRQIHKEGYKGAESTVRAYIREKFKKPRPACPIEHRPADEVQFDFGQCAVKVGESAQLIYFVGSVFPYSTRRFLFPYPAERQECLFDAIECTYQKAGGISQRSTLDNTKLAVAKVLQGHRREETEAYTRFRVLLGLTPRFTNVAAGWEKGHVEGAVGWAKRQVFLDLEVENWEELQKVLDEACEEDARTRRHGPENKLVQELFEEERQLLRSLPYVGRRSYRRVRAQVSPGGLVYVDGSRYSVPIRLRGRHVRVQLYWDELVMTHEHEEVARHRRNWKGRGEHYQVEHYLGLLERAPALLDHGKPFTRMPEWLQRTREALGDDKGLVQLLLAVDAGRYCLGELQEACLEAMEGRCVTRALIEQRAILRRSGASEEVPALEESECGTLSSHRFEIESPEVYDEILVSAREEVA